MWSLCSITLSFVSKTADLSSRNPVPKDRHLQNCFWNMSSVLSVAYCMKIKDKGRFASSWYHTKRQALFQTETFSRPPRVYYRSWGMKSGLSLCKWTPTEESENKARELFLHIGYSCGVVSYKASHATATICWHTALPIWVLIIPDPSSRVICSAADTHSSEAGRNLARNVRNFGLQVSLFIPLGFIYIL
jgi:hypothetical protein